MDNALGVNQLIYSPAALTHEYHPKTATITASTFVSSSPSHSCAFQESRSEIMDFYGDRLWGGGVDGGNTALLFGTFMSGINSKFGVLSFGWMLLSFLLITCYLVMISCYCDAERNICLIFLWRSDTPYFFVYWRTIIHWHSPFFVLSRNNTLTFPPATH